MSIRRRRAPGFKVPIVPKPLAACLHRRIPAIDSEAWRDVTQRILVVCVGNICRSPTAEILFRHYAPDLAVGSAGISALSGEPMDQAALAVLRDHDLDGSSHLARQLHTTLIDAADLILTMEQSHLDAIERDTPNVTGRIFLLDQWHDEADVDDPFGQPRAAFDAAYRRIDAAVQAWLPQLHLR